MKFIIFFALLMLTLTGCRQAPHERHYQEIMVEAPSASSLTWQIPLGWKQGTGDQMRLVRFYSLAHPQAMDCSITVLAGDAGGLQANLARWFRQLGVAPTDDILNQLQSSSQTVSSADHHEIKVVQDGIACQQNPNQDKPN